MAIIDGVRDIPGLAPKAATFNRISSNLDYLNGLNGFRGALIYKTGSQSILIISEGDPVEVTFAAARYDTSSIWSGGSPNRLTVPSGVTRVKIKGNILFNVTQATTRATLVIYKNGNPTLGPGGSGAQFAMAQSYGDTGAGTTIAGLMVESPPIVCVATDYFTLENTFNGMNGTISLTVGSWLSMEVIE